MNKGELELRNRILETKGEIKKRILQQILADMGIVSFDRTILPTLDEAKKEFKVYMRDEFDGDEDDYIAYIEKTIIKWFGE